MVFDRVWSTPIGELRRVLSVLMRSGHRTLDVGASGTISRYLTTPILTRLLRCGMAALLPTTFLIGIKPAMIESGVRRFRAKTWCPCFRRLWRQIQNFGLS